MVGAAAWLTQRRRLMLNRSGQLLGYLWLGALGVRPPALCPIRLSALIERRGIRLRLRSLRVLKDGQGGPPSRCQA